MAIIMPRKTVPERIDELRVALARTVELLKEEDFRGAPDEEVFARIAARHAIDLPRLTLDEAGEPIVKPTVTVNGPAIVIGFRVKAEGDAASFHLDPVGRPGSSPLVGYYADSAIVFSYAIPDQGQGPEEIRADAERRFRGDLAQYREHLDRLADDIRAGRDRIRRAVLEMIAARRRTIEKAAEVRRQLEQ